MTTNALVCPFLTDDPMFAAGVEFGILFARMNECNDQIGGIFLRKNQDRIFLLASRLGWTVDGIHRIDRFWFSCQLTKDRPSPFDEDRLYAG